MKESQIHIYFLHKGIPPRYLTLPNEYFLILPLKKKKKFNIPKILILEL